MFNHERRRDRSEERREEREEHRHGRFGDRGERLREDRGEHLRLHGIRGLGDRPFEDHGERLREDRGERLSLREDRGDLLRERREEYLRPQRYDQDIPHYAPPAGPPPGGYNRADFVSDDDFQRMMRSGEFENPRMGGSIGPEDYGEWDRSRPPANDSYQPHNSYVPPTGAPGPHSEHAPMGGFNPTPGPPPQFTSSHGYGTSQTEGAGRGAANEYYNGPPPGQQTHPYTHSIPDMSAAHSDSSNPALYQRYNEASQGLHENYQTQQHHPSGEFDEEKYSSHFAAHAQAYGSDSDGRPMANDDIGAAAAVEALKITASNNQQSNVRPQQGGRPQGGFHPATNMPQDRPSSAQQGGRPNDGRPHERPENEDGCELEGDGRAAQPQAPTGSGSPQDKIIALAMAQAGKLFDKKGGGDNQGKTQAMQAAAATAMRMMTEYKSTGKVNMQPGEMQKLMGLAMSLF